jgi:DNA-binding beta-propeller fold protein YncE
MGNLIRPFIMAAIFVALASASGFLCPLSLQAQSKPPQYEVDPYWPKPLPDQWLTGGIGGVCVDAQDHVFILNRRDLSDNEMDAAHQAPPVIEFDPEGNVVNSFGDPEAVPAGLHGCTVDRNNNLWMGGAQDGIIQKYSHDGKLLLQIGKKGVVDSSDGTLKGQALNSSHSAFFMPSGVAIDPNNGDIYVSDGEGHGGNHRVAVFDSGGQFLRQWELHRSESEVGETFLPIAHCVAMSNDGLVYVCDRRAHRIQVFDKMGNFQKDIPIKFEQRTQYPTGPEHGSPGRAGTAVWVAFSPDHAQRFMYVSNQDDEQIDIVDRASGQILSSFGRAGHQVGELTYIHQVALDSKGNVFIAEVSPGKAVVKFKVAGSR